MMMKTQLILAATGTLFLTACVDPNAYPNDPNARQRNGAIIGGIGVSGMSSPQDAQVARAGLAAL